MIVKYKIKKIIKKLYFSKKMENNILIVSMPFKI